MMILDRQRYWGFLKAYLICFTALVGLYVVIHAFSNIDEFMQVESGFELLAKMGRYYLVNMSQFYDRLCGVITMMAAIFTVTWVQRDNELLAMLAAGMGTKRVIRPVLISAVLVNGLAVVNQEWIMPQIAEELQRDPADHPRKTLIVSPRLDLRDILVGGKDADRQTATVFRFAADFPVGLVGPLGGVEARQARYIPPDARGVPLRGGWLLRGVRLRLMEDAAIDPSLLVKVDPKELPRFPPASGDSRTLADLDGDAYFFHTNVSFEVVTRNRAQWYHFATTPDLIRAIADPACKPEREDIAIFLHTRVLRPFMSMALLMVSLPLVLGGDGRNMFVNLGLSLGTSAVFYGLSFVAQYLAGNADLTPEMAAWAPLILFSTIAVARWDTIRT